MGLRGLLDHLAFLLLGHPWILDAARDHLQANRTNDPCLHAASLHSEHPWTTGMPNPAKPKAPHIEVSAPRFPLRANPR